MKFVTAVLVSTLVIAPAAMIAQTPTPGAHDYNINQRKVDQQDRMATASEREADRRPDRAPGTPGSRHQ